MAVSEAASESTRARARIFGVTSQVLAVVNFLGTLYLTAKAANVGWQFGVSGPRNLVAWIIFASGLFAACELAGFGYTRVMLCAIYDRQEPVASVVNEIPLKGPRRYALAPAPYRPSPITLESDGMTASTGPTSSPVPLPQTAVLEPKVQPAAERSRLREWLTRERHLTRVDSD